MQPSRFSGRSLTLDIYTINVIIPTGALIETKGYMTAKKWFFYIAGTLLFIAVAGYLLYCVMAYDWNSLPAKAKKEMGYGTRLQYQSRLIVDDICVTNTVEVLLADPRLTKSEKDPLKGKDPSAMIVMRRYQGDWPSYGADADRYDTIVQSVQTNTVAFWLSCETLPEQVKESIRELDLADDAFIAFRVLKQTPR